MKTLKLILTAAGLLGAALVAPVLSAQPAPATAKVEPVERFRTETFVDGLTNPWAIAWLPDGSALITERPGRLRIVSPEGELRPEPVEGIPAVWARGQGGLLDVEVHPEYERTGWIYLAFSRPVGANAITEIVRGKLRDGRWVDPQTVLTVPDAEATRSTVHFGCRMRFGPDGLLYFSIGERGAQANAQQLENHKGKIFRVREDGSIPEDNPFVGRDGAIAAIWSYGHRNPQGLAWDLDTPRLWSTEHGPRGGDELNVVRKGANYGWPVITYGINYNGTKVSDLTEKAGMEQPAYQWTPSIGASGLEFYTGDRFPKWRGSLFAGGLALQCVWRFQLDGDRVVGHEVILENQGRVRDVRQGPDGLLYIVFDQPGKVVRLAPRS